mgnify:CR=1 FL=1
MSIKTRMTELLSLSERTKFLHSPDGSPENEGEMAKAQLENIAAIAKRLNAILIDEDQLPAWVQDYITSAEEALESVASYIEPKSRKTGD